MCVVTNKHYCMLDYGEKLRKEHRCSSCGGRLFFPFVWWRGYGCDAETAGYDLYICSKCASAMRTGLVADLIQCTAIVEMRQLAGAYNALTLDRRQVKDVENDTVQKEQETHRKLLAEARKSSTGPFSG